MVDWGNIPKLHDFLDLLGIDSKNCFPQAESNHQQRVADQLTRFFFHKLV